MFGLLGAYLFFAIGMNVLNSALYNKDRWNYQHPLLMTALTFVAQWLLGMALLSYRQQKRSAKVANGSSIDWKRVLPCAFFSAADIGLSNYALSRVPLTVYVMVKSASPVFIFAASVLMGMHTLDGLQHILFIVCGTSLAIYPIEHDGIHSPNSDLDWMGVGLVLGATACTGLRWCLTQAVTKSHPSNGPLMTVATLSLPIAVLLFGVSVFIEPAHSYAIPNVSALSTAGIMALLSCWTFVLIWVEYVMVHRASAITLSIAGIIKELLLIGFGVLVVRDHQLHLLNWMGLGVSIAGILMHHLHSHGKADEVVLPDELLVYSAQGSRYGENSAPNNADWDNPFWDHNEFDDNDIVAEGEEWVKRSASVVYDAIRGKATLSRPSSFFWSQAESPVKQRTQELALQ